MFHQSRYFIVSRVIPLLLGAFAPAAHSAYVFPSGAQAQVQAVTNINHTIAPTPATQSISLATGTTTSTSVSGSTGSASASANLGTGELKANATSTAGFTSQANGWEFVTFSGSGTVNYSLAVDGSLSNLYPAGSVSVEAAVRVFDVTSWTSYFGSLSGQQFAAYNGSGSPFPYLAGPQAYDIQGVQGASSTGCATNFITNCTVDSAGTSIPVNLNLSGSFSAVAGNLYLVDLLLNTTTFNQQMGILAQTGDFSNTATFNFTELNGLAFESSSGEFLTASPVPVPAAVWLFGSGLLGLVGVARRKVRGRVQ